MFKSFSSGIILAIILIAASAFTSVMILDKCGKTVAPNTSVADSIMRVTDSVTAAQQYKIDSLILDDKVWQTKYYDAWNKFVQSVTVISKKSDSIKTISAAFLNAKKANDTVAQLANCDELESQVNDLLSELSSAETIVDSLKSASDSTIGDKDVAIDLLVAEVNNYKNALNALNGQYQILVAQDKKNISKAKFADIVAKISTIAAGVLGIVMLLK